MRARPFSMLIELTMARPGYCSSASLMTSASVLVDDERCFEVEGEFFDEFAHDVAFVGAFGEGDADVEGVGAFFHLGRGRLRGDRRSRRRAVRRLTFFEPWVLSRSPTMRGAGSCWRSTDRIMLRDCCAWGAWADGEGRRWS